jgi:hypothetical protein
LDATIRRAGDGFPENLRPLSKHVKTAGAIGDFLVNTHSMTAGNSLFKALTDA